MKIYNSIQILSDHLFYGVFAVFHLHFNYIFEFLLSGYACKLICTICHRSEATVRGGIPNSKYLSERNLISGDYSKEEKKCREIVED